MYLADGVLLLSATDLTVVEIPSAGADPHALQIAHAATLAALRARADVVYQAALHHGRGPRRGLGRGRVPATLPARAPPTLAPSAVVAWGSVPHLGGEIREMVG